MASIATVRERKPGESRVALAPDGVGRLARAGHSVFVETAAGTEAGFADSLYVDRGARIPETAGAAIESADLLVKVNEPEIDEVAALGGGKVLVSLLQPTTHLELVRDLAGRGVTAFALDAIPRISRAQSMDVLTSMSTLAGYRAAVLGAYLSPRLYPLLITAAGTVPPARVLVIGAGVAGLQAIATARRLGARVEAFDTRPAVKEEVQSLGARFVDVDLGEEGGADEGGYAKELREEGKRRQREALADHVEGADVVLTTALVPGRPAPRILSAEMVARMRPGSVVVDLAAPAGGNCELTLPGETIVEQGVTICGPLNLPAAMPGPASSMFSRNVIAFLELLLAEGELRLDLEDEILRGCCVTHRGSVLHEETRRALEES